MNNNRQYRKWVKLNDKPAEIKGFKWRIMPGVTRVFNGVVHKCVIYDPLAGAIYDWRGRFAPTEAGCRRLAREDIERAKRKKEEEAQFNAELEEFLKSL
jgi:hypothetical protein